MDLEVRSSDWGPGSRAERLGARRHWIEAADGGCCSLPDGWGTDRLPAHMERVVRSWEDEEGHGRYVDRQQQVLVSSGARRHVVRRSSPGSWRLVPRPLTEVVLFTMRWEALRMWITRRCREAQRGEAMMRRRYGGHAGCRGAVHWQGGLWQG